ncbi:glycine cleavage system protein H [Nosocomiicoccus massiliensis]|uniref:glycine cleavage system protein H n=1 Tax=Nosocomiicoccus massiliensis TaxID=1232430 RepID=UPI00041EEC18|nr:glycine cleavage system protein H [Nosocomiicoccus massiliensis]
MRKTANYLWIDKDGDTYTLVLTPELQDDIGTVGYVQFSKEDVVKKDDSLLELEGSKTVLDLMSPLAGTVVERNTKAIDTPEILNASDANESWVVKLTDVDEDAFNALDDAQ